jgi:hypothetical protein
MTETRAEAMRTLAGPVSGVAFLAAPSARANDSRIRSVEFIGMALVTQFEYRELPPGYPAVTTCESYWSRLLAAKGLSRLDQARRTGALR